MTIVSLALVKKKDLLHTQTIIFKHIKINFFNLIIFINLINLFYI